MRWSLLILAGIVLGTLFAPVLVPYDPLRTDPAGQLQPPSAAHLMGTDLLGRDVWSRALYGGRQSLLVAALATAIAVCPGMALGALAATLRGRADTIIVTLLDALLAFPGMMLALVTLTVLGRGVLPLAVAVGVAQIAPYARVTRAAVLAVRSMVYVEAAMALGATRQQLMLRHILPNAQTTLLAYAGVVFSYSLLNGAALSFLGLGGEPGVPDWGVMLADGRAAFRTAPWIGFAPGLAITLTVLAVNRLVDELMKR